MTVSPECSSTSRWSLWAIRRSADSGSPWLPVQIAITFSSGKSSISLGWMKMPSGALAMPRLEAMLKFLRIERPTSATLPVELAAASITCWTRCTLDAKQVTMIRPSQPAKNCLQQRRPDGRLGGRRRRAGRRWWSRRRDRARPREPSSASRAMSAGTAVDRGLVELVVAGDQHRAELGAAARRRARRGSSATCGSSRSRTGRAVTRSPGLQLLERGVAELVLVELRADQAEGQQAAVDRAAGMPSSRST